MPMGLILLLISGFNLYQTITLQHSNLAEVISLEEKAYIRLAQESEQRTFDYYANRINTLTSSRKDILQAFADRDRKKLLTLCQPIYESLQKENSSFAAFHFFLPDNTSFLRVHKPVVYGDTLTDLRPLVLAVNRTHIQHNGFEVDASGILYRVSQPLFINEEYIGAFEFGIEIDHLLTTLRDSIQGEIALLIDAKKLQKAPLLSAQEKKICGSDILLSAESIFSTENTSDFNFHCNNDSAQLVHNGHTYHVSKNVTVDDYLGNPIATVIIAMDISKHIQKAQNFLKLSITTTTILIIAAIFFLHISVGRLVNKIFALNVSLKDVNTTLQSTINQRTDELEHEIHEREHAFKTLAEEIHQRHEIELQLEKESIKSVKLESIGVLAGGIAHDFNNILAAILGNINLAAMVTGPDHEIHDMLKTAEEATIRARDLTTQLLLFSKSSSPVKQTLSIQEVIEDASQFMPNGYQVDRSFDQHGAIWPVEIDHGQLSQVFQNILSNACQAMPDGGIITISCTNIDQAAAHSLSLPENNYVQVTIHDSGCGIDKKSIGRIFDPYFSTKERDSQKGSGLGLAIVHSIIMQHDGFIKVDSVQGEGATFSIFLPACPGRNGSSRQDEAEQNKGRKEGKILLMDDEQIVLDVAQMMLSHMGYEVATAKNGEEMLNLYQQEIKTGKGFSVVIMDVTIVNGMGGKQAVKELLTIDPSAKSIVSSGYANDPIMANYQEYGFIGALTKPFQVEELWRTLRKTTSESKIHSSHFKV